MAFTYAGQYTQEILGTSAAGFAVPLPALAVNVYTVGTTTAVTLYTSRTKGTTTANPVSTDVNANVTIFVDPGQYDLVFTPPGGSAKRITVSVPVDAAESGTYLTVVPVAAATGVTATDWANVNGQVTAAQAIAAAGGNPEVRFPAGTFSLGSHSIPIYAGVRYVGVPPQLIPQNTTPGAGMPDGEWNYVGGTILTGDGTAPAFTDGTVDQPGSVPATFLSAAFPGVRLYGFGLDGFTYGIKSGAVNKMGLQWGEVDQIYAKNCSVWGVYFANFQHIKFGYIGTCLGPGQYYAALVPSSTLNPGNSTFEYLFHKTVSNVNTTRGIVFDAQSPLGTAVLGSIVADAIQHNTYNRLLTSQTATFTNASSTVAVTDGTKFAVGMPVYFTASGNGFNGSVAYYVLSVAGNNLTLGTGNYATAIAATGSGTLTIQTHGMAAVEMQANTGGAIGMNLKWLDIEGNPTVGLHTENMQTSRIWMGATGADIHLVARNALNTFYYSDPDIITDVDGATRNSSIDTAGLVTAYGKILPGRQINARDATVQLGPNRAVATRPWASGYYRGIDAVSYSAGLLSNNAGNAAPIDLPAGTLSKIGINVTVAGNAGSVIRLAVYYDSAGLPGARLVDAGTVAGDTTGYKELSPNIRLQAGRYHLVAVAQSSATTAPTVSTALPSYMQGNPSGTSAATGANSNYVFTTTGFSGAAPANFTVNGQGGGNVANVVVLVA